MRSIILLMALLLLAPATVGGVAPLSDYDDAHDLVLLHPDRPYRLRLHLRLEGRSFQQTWARQVERLFAHLDANGDGKLSKEEASRAPGREQWRQLSAGLPLEPEGAPPFGELAEGDAFATLAQLRAYYQPTSSGPVRVQTCWRFGVFDLITKNLFKLLDKNRDGKLSAEEMQTASTRMSRLDRNEDEMLSIGELSGEQFNDAQLTFGPASPAHGLVSLSFPFLSARPGSSRVPLVRVLNERYAEDKEKAAAALDARPDGVLRVDLDRGERGVSVMPGSRLTFQATAVGMQTLLPEHCLEVRCAGVLPTPKRVAIRVEFRSLDTNNDGFLDNKEAFKPPFEYVAWLRLADKDQDGKVSAKEFAEFREAANALSGSVTTLQIEDQQQSLLPWLDTDDDRRLSVRELRNVHARLTAATGKKTDITPQDLPQRFVITLQHGGATNRDGMRLLRPIRTAGPAWFRKMDSNGDGDVSRSEWLGSTADFDAIDADTDGLISVEEAEATDRRYRKGPIRP